MGLSEGEGGSPWLPDLPSPIKTGARAWLANQWPWRGNRGERLILQPLHHLADETPALHHTMTSSTSVLLRAHHVSELTWPGRRVSPLLEPHL